MLYVLITGVTGSDAGNVNVTQHVRPQNETSIASDHTHLFVVSICGSNGTDDRDLKSIRPGKDMPRKNETARRRDGETARTKSR